MKSCFSHTLMGKADELSFDLKQCSCFWNFSLPSFVIFLSGSGNLLFHSCRIRWLEYGVLTPTVWTAWALTRESLKHKGLFFGVGKGGQKVELGKQRCYLVFVTWVIVSSCILLSKLIAKVLQKVTKVTRLGFKLLLALCNFGQVIDTF